MKITRFIIIIVGLFAIASNLKAETKVDVVNMMRDGLVDLAGNKGNFDSGGLGELFKSLETIEGKVLNEEDITSDLGDFSELFNSLSESLSDIYEEVDEALKEGLED